jgi:hypothetical protein
VGRRHPSWPLVLALSAAVALAAYVAAWVPHASPALRVTGLDLAEYVKFLPEVRSGEIVLTRELFYLPLPACALAFLLAAWASRSPWRGLLRMLAVPISVFAALLLLPPVWTPQTLWLPEFRKQSAALAICLGCTLASPLLGVGPIRRIFGWTVALLALAAAVIPIHRFLMVLPALEAAYGRSLSPGNGVWLTSVAFLMVAWSCIQALRDQPYGASQEATSAGRSRALQPGIQR